MAVSLDKTSWYDFITYGFMTPLVETGLERQIDSADIPELAESEDTAANSKLLSTSLLAQERQGNDHPLLRAVVSTYGCSLFILQVCYMSNFGLGLLNPYLLKRLLVFQEAQNDKHGKLLTEEQVHAGLLAVAMFIGLGVVQMFLGFSAGFFQCRLNVRMSSALRGVVLERSLAVRTCDASAGASGGDAKDDTPTPLVYNVLSFDVGANIDILWIIMDLIKFPIQTMSVMLLLFREVSWAVLPGIAVIFLVKIVCFILLIRDGYLREAQLQAKDRRMGLCEEGFHNARTLQMLAWTTPFLGNISAARAEELRATSGRLWMQKIVAALGASLAPVVSFVTLGWYVMHGNGELKASVALPVISLVSSLIGPFSAFPSWANRYLIWRSAYDRVNKYMGTYGGVGTAAGGIGRHAPAPPSTAASAVAAAGDVPVGPVAELQDCSLAWQRPAAGCGGGAAGAAGGDWDAEAGGADGEEAKLLAAPGTEAVVKGASLQVWPSQLWVVTGAPSQGKTSLLGGLLGELAVIDGELRSPAVVGGEAAQLLPDNIAQARAEATGGAALESSMLPFAAQTPSLFLGTIRANILFGARHDANIYAQVIKACHLETDLSVMTSGDSTEISQGGSTLSGGQRARIGLARAVYRAVLVQQDHPDRTAPLVLLDDPFCGLDRRVAKDVVRALFASGSGLLCRCAVVVAASDPWWLEQLHRAEAEAEAEAPATQDGKQEGREGDVSLMMAVLRAGGIVASGSLSEVAAMGLSELDSFVAAAGSGSDSGGDAGSSGDSNDNNVDAHASQATAAGTSVCPSTPSDEEEPEPEDSNGKDDALKPLIPKVVGKKMIEANDKTAMWTPPLKKRAGQLVDRETRQGGSVRSSTYITYVMAMGPGMLAMLAFALVGIEAFNSLCTLWVAYWTDEDRPNMFLDPFFKRLATDKHGEESPHTMLTVYGYWIAGLTAANFLGHGLEIVGGIRAARVLFAEALLGTMTRPFRWWDANPVGRVLNRFSEDVRKMDEAVSDIIGITFGAVLYLVCHIVVLAMANPVTLAMLPVVMFSMEHFARYYRMSIRELQRLYLVTVSCVYQEMVEAITGKVTIRAFSSARCTVCSSISALDNLQRVGFTSTCVKFWIGFRIAVIGFALNTYTKLHPVLQYFGMMSPQSAAMVGFSITYSAGIVGTIQQFIRNYSDLEMQMISIERLCEYGAGRQELEPPANGESFGIVGKRGGGLILANLKVTYRPGLPPALSGVNLSFPHSEAAAIVGRTGAGKTSLLLSILQLVPYAGTISVGNWKLADLIPRVVRTSIVSVVPQQPVFFKGGLRFNVDPEGKHTEAELFDALTAVGLRGLCGALSSTDSRTALSQGEQQMLSAARALLRRPHVVLLDEVTACLPAETAKETLETMLARFKEFGSTILVVTHQEPLLQSCDRIVRIMAGHVVSDQRVAAATA